MSGSDNLKQKGHFEIKNGVGIVVPEAIHCKIEALEQRTAGKWPLSKQMFSLKLLIKIYLFLKEFKSLVCLYIDLACLDMHCLRLALWLSFI